MKKSIIRISFFLIILALTLGYVNSIFKFKFTDGIYELDKFYELEKNTVDLLFLGSSHAFEDFNPAVLWDEYGTASYVLGASTQPSWNTYYFLKEALKTQKPKLIVFESYCMILPWEYLDDSTIIKNNFGLHWSPDKIRSVLTSTSKDRWSDFLLEYSQYHNRYESLTREDFVKDLGNPEYTDWKGYLFNPLTSPLEKNPDTSHITEKTELNPKGEEYYRALIELAQENEIPIMVVLTPFAGVTADEQKIFNRIEEIADEYAVPFVNFNFLYQETGLDYAVDAADPGHLNYKGSAKFTRFFGEYLRENYSFDFPDHRGDSRYASWQTQADINRKMTYNQDIIDTEDTTAIMQKVLNENYWIFLSVSGDYYDDMTHLYLEALGIDDENASGTAFLRDGEVVWHSSKSDPEFYISHLSHDFYLGSIPDGNIIRINNEPVQSDVINGIDIVVYDSITDKVVTTLNVSASE